MLYIIKYTKSFNHWERDYDWNGLDAILIARRMHFIHLTPKFKSNQWRVGITYTCEPDYSYRWFNYFRVYCGFFHLEWV